MVDLLVRPEAKGLLTVKERQRLARRMREALRILGRSACQVTLVCTTDPEIRQLNRDYRHIDRATDVLSFHQYDLQDENDPAGKAVYLGDIVISLETALRRSGAGRLQGELARLAIHGLCHLWGYDHHRPGPAQRMRALENRLLRATR